MCFSRQRAEQVWGSCPSFLQLPSSAFSGSPRLDTQKVGSGHPDAPSGGSRTAARRMGCPQLLQLSPPFGLPGGRGGRVRRTQPDLLTAQQRYRKCQVDIGEHVQAVPVTPEGKNTRFGTSSPLASAMALGLTSLHRGPAQGRPPRHGRGTRSRAPRHTRVPEPTCAAAG